MPLLHSIDTEKDNRILNPDRFFIHGTLDVEPQTQGKDSSKFNQVDTRKRGQKTNASVLTIFSLRY